MLYILLLVVNSVILPPFQGNGAICVFLGHNDYGNSEKIPVMCSIKYTMLVCKTRGLCKALDFADYGVVWCAGGQNV